MLNRNRFLNIQQFVIDPEHEYEEICKKLNGTLIKFGTYQVINVLDIRKTILEEGESYLKNKIAKLNVFFSFVFLEMTEEEKAILEDKIIECYKQKGITEDNKSLFKDDCSSNILKKQKFKTAEDMPLLEDLYKLLKADKKMKKYATILNPYIKGRLSYLNKLTNVNIENSLVVVDIHELNESDLPMIMFIIMDYFWDRIRENRTEKKILYLDEVWKMIYKNPMTAEFVFNLFKTIRKYGGGATAVTQDINDFFLLEDGKYGKGILNNSSIKCLFQMEENDIYTLEKVLQLSEEEKIRLVNMERGTMLLQAGRNHLIANVIAAAKEHFYITTDSEELKNNMKGMSIKNEKNINSIR